MKSPKKEKPKKESKKERKKREAEEKKLAEEEEKKRAEEEKARSQQFLIKGDGVGGGLHRFQDGHGQTLPPQIQTDPVEQFSPEHTLSRESPNNTLTSNQLPSQFQDSPEKQSTIKESTIQSGISPETLNQSPPQLQGIEQPERQKTQKEMDLDKAIAGKASRVYELELEVEEL